MQTRRIFEKIKLCRKSLPFASLAECKINLDINNKLSETALEDIVFKLPGSQITGSSRHPLCFNFNFE